MPTNLEDATRYINEKVILEIWVRSGGRCARCNRFLLEDELSERTINLGERAHIVGWINTKKSPRGISDLPLAERNEAKNLVLLCMSCHKVVDDATTREEYPVERLLEMKQEHEDRVFHLTGISPDRETAVLRIFGAIRGSMPELAREVALQTVVNGAGRYAKFHLAPNRHSIELDLSAIPDPETLGSKAYWKAGQIKIDEIAVRISDAVRQNHIRHLSVFALARIPLLVYLGYVLDDKVPVDIYQKHRGTDEGWLWPEDDIQPVVFETSLVRPGTHSKEATLILSLSGTINTSELPAEVADMPIYEIKPKDIVPNRDLFRSQATADAFARSYHDFLSALEQEADKPTMLHLFPAAPITAAIACGRGIMRQVHPAITIYDRIANQFEQAIVINKS